MLTFRGPPGLVTGLVFSPDGRFLAAVVHGPSGGLFVWDLSRPHGKGRRRKNVSALAGWAGDRLRLIRERWGSPGPGGLRLRGRVWAEFDPRTRRIGELPRGVPELTNAAAGPGGTDVLFGGNAVEWWDVLGEGARPAWRVTTATEPVTAAAVSPDGGRLAVATESARHGRGTGHRIGFFQTADGKTLPLRADGPGRVTDLGWSPDGRFLAGTASLRLAVWDAATLTPLAELAAAGTRLFRWPAVPPVRAVPRGRRGERRGRGVLVGHRVLAGTGRLPLAGRPGQPGGVQPGRHAGGGRGREGPGRGLGRGRVRREPGAAGERDDMLKLPPKLPRVRTLAFSPDDRFLLAVGMKPQIGGLLRLGSRLGLWDLADPAAAPSLPIDHGLDPVAGFFLPDGRALGVDNRGSWRACRVGGGDPTACDRHRVSRQYTPAAVSPDGRWLLLASRDRYLCRPMAGGDEGEPAGWQAALGYDRWVGGVAFSPSSGAVAAALREPDGPDGPRWWCEFRDTAGGLLLRDVLGLRWPVERLAWSPDGRFLVAAGGTGFQVLAADRGAVVARRVSAGSVTTAAFHPSGRWFATTDEAGRVLFWDPGEWDEPSAGEGRDRPPARALDWGVGPVQALAFSPDGTLGAVAGAEGEVVVWDADE